MEEEKIASEQQDKIKEYENLVALRNKIKSEAKKQIKEIKLSALKKLAEIDTKSAKKLATRQKRDEKKALEAGIPKRYSIGEEIFNSVTHGIGAGLSIAALVLLIVRAVFNAPEGETGFYVTGFTLFGPCFYLPIDSRHLYTLLSRSNKRSLGLDYFWRDLGSCYFRNHILQYFWQPDEDSFCFYICPYGVAGCNCLQTNNNFSSGNYC